MSEIRLVDEVIFDDPIERGKSLLRVTVPIKHVGSQGNSCFPVIYIPLKIVLSKKIDCTLFLSGYFGINGQRLIKFTGEEFSGNNRDTQVCLWMPLSSYSTKYMNKLNTSFFVDISVTLYFLESNYLTKKEVPVRGGYNRLEVPVHDTFDWKKWQKKSGVKKLLSSTFRKLRFLNIIWSMIRNLKSLILKIILYFTPIDK